MGSFASQGAVWSYMAIPPEEAGQADFGFPAIAIGAEVDLYSPSARSLRLRT